MWVVADLASTEIRTFPRHLGLITPRPLVIDI
jgi:hypothetical protein